MRAIAPGLLTPPLWGGLLMLCLLPSTVQSSIAFTSIARGNVAAALCAATASNLFGILLTPLLAGLLLSAHGGFSAHGGGRHRGAAAAAVRRRPACCGRGSARGSGDHKMLGTLVDRGSILLVVYVAFSEGVTHGIWHQLDARQLATLALLDAVLLGAVLLATSVGSRLLGFDRADRITIVFCGSKKSLASGLPMASVLFAGQSVGLIVLPLMLFHQIQLMVCAALARRYAAAERGDHACGAVRSADRASGGSAPSAGVTACSELVALQELDDLAVGAGDEGDPDLGWRFATERRGPRRERVRRAPAASARA